MVRSYIKLFQITGKTVEFNSREKVKLVVADSMPEKPDKALNEHKRSCIDALVSSLEAMLS